MATATATVQIHVTKEHKNIFEAILGIMQDVDYVQKTKAKEGGVKYAVKSEEAILDKIRPAMVEHGVIMYPTNVTDESYSNYNTTNAVWNRLVAKFTYRFHHVATGTFVDTTLVGEGADTGDKASNKAMTVSKKYALLETFLLITGNDPDEEDSPAVTQKTQEVKTERPYAPEVLIAKLRKAAGLYADKSLTVDQTTIDMQKATLQILSSNEADKITTMLFGVNVEGMNHPQWLAVAKWLEDEQTARVEVGLLKGS